MKKWDVMRFDLARYNLFMQFLCVSFTVISANNRENVLLRVITFLCGLALGGGVLAQSIRLHKGRLHNEEVIK